MKRIVTKVLASVAVVGALGLLGGVSAKPAWSGDWPTPVVDSER